MAWAFGLQREWDTTREHDDGSITLKFAGERPPTLNAERAAARGRWSRSEITRRWRERASVQAKNQKLPSLQVPVVVLAVPHHKDKRSPQDTAACVPAVKAVIDGLVDAGVLPGDGPLEVARVIFDGPVVDGWDGLELTVREWT